MFLKYCLQLFNSSSGHGGRVTFHLYGQLLKNVHGKPKCILRSQDIVIGL